MITIALVDDNNLFRNALAYYLKREDRIQVLFDVCNGQELLTELKTLRMLPKIILMDINMPVMDGKAATRIINSLYPSIKIIALSVFHHDHLINNMLSLGVHGYLSKNAEPEVLKEAIDVVNDDNYFIETSYGKFEVFKRLPNNVLAVNLNNTFTITNKQKRFLQLCAEGKSYFDIAEQMQISEKTANKYRELLCKRFKQSNRGELVHYSIQNGLVDILK